MRESFLKAFNLLRRKGILPILALAYALPSAPSAASTAYLLDVGGIRDNSELYLVGALQGLVNRDAPRLFKSNYEGAQTPGSGNKWAEYLQAEKGINWVTLPSLGEAVKVFKDMKGLDGQPLIKGLIKYQPTYWDGTARVTVDKNYHYWIAANYAAQENLLPVTADILANRTDLLGTSGFWYIDTKMTHWRESFASAVNSADGLTVTAAHDSKALQMGAYFYKWMNVDLNVTPKIEITVSKLSPGGKWGFAINLGSTVDLNGNLGTVPIYENRTDTGTFTFDMKSSGLFNPLSGRAGLKICAMSPRGSVTVKQIRFLDAGGNVPTTPIHVPPTDAFSGMTLVRDLTDLGANPQMADEAQARNWSLKNQLPLCDKNSAFLANSGYGTVNSIDEAIANKTYFYHDQKSPYADATPDLDYLLGYLNPTSRLGGGIGNSEDWMILKYSSYGHRQVALPANFSFWKKIPAEGIKLPQHRHVTSLQSKFYINFTQASGDVIDQPVGFVNGWWFDPLRGTMPYSWGFNSALAEAAPAFVEYFAKKASKMDNFFTGPSGSGYSQFSVMGAEKMAAFAHLTRKDIQMLGMSPAFDNWDGANGDLIFKAFTQTATDTTEPIQLMTPLPRGPAYNHWMDDGTPIIYQDQTLGGLWSGDDRTTPTDLANRLKAVALARPEGGPFFLSCNIRFSPAFYKETMAQLDPEKFQMVGMPDFIALAQEAGALQVKPYSNGVGGGDTLKISLELTNAGGATGAAGTISWTMPAGWSASEAKWDHELVPHRGVLKHTVTFIAPKTLGEGPAPKLVFKDSRSNREKSILLNTYQRGHTVNDASSLTGWTGSAGAQVKLENGMVKVLPAHQRDRDDAETARYVTKTTLPSNGRVFCDLGTVDFGSRPIVEVNIPDLFSNSTDIGIIDSTGRYRRLASVRLNGTYALDMVGWSGVQRNMRLAIDPATTFGQYVFVRSVKVFAQPLTAVRPDLAKTADYSIKRMGGSYQIQIRGDGAHKVELIRPNGTTVATYTNRGAAFYDWRAPAPGMYLMKLTLGKERRLVTLAAFD